MSQNYNRQMPAIRPIKPARTHGNNSTYRAIDRARDPHPLTIINPRLRPHFRRNESESPLNIFQLHRSDHPPAA